MIPSELLAAYRATRYVVEHEGSAIILEVDSHSPALDRLLAARSLDEAAIITAWNPGSRLRPLVENQRMAATLKAEIADLRLAMLPVTAMAPDPGWNEPGLLILGIAEPLACGIGARYGQNAIIHIRRAGTPRLIDIANDAIRD